MSLVDRLIARYERRLPDFVIGDKDFPYLKRWYVIPRNKFFNIYLHNILRSDDDRALHDHPWLTQVISEADITEGVDLPLPKGCKPLAACVVCGSTDLKSYLDLGRQPLANAFQVEPGWPRYPLGLNHCRSCHHSQLTHAVDPEILFRDYAYISGTSASLRNYFENFVTTVEFEFNRTYRNLVVLEVGSNDGTLLSIFKQRGHKVLGVDPATNLMQAARANGVETINTFFDANVALPDKYDVIIMMNVLAHTADPLTMLKTAKDFLAPGGRIYVQTSQARMLVEGQFDTVYHEHISFFTAASFCKLADQVFLHTLDIQHVDVHGTSYLVTFGNEGNMLTRGDFPLWHDEKAQGFYGDGCYAQFQYNASLVAEHAVNTIEQHKKAGYRIAGYGAAAKATVFMNATGFRPDYVIDDSPLKVGKLVPGTNVHVTSREVLSQPGKTLFVIFPWNMRAEIMGKIRKERAELRKPETDDRFLTYFPTLELT